MKIGTAYQNFSTPRPAQASRSSQQFSEVMKETANKSASAEQKFDFTDMTPASLHETVGSLIRAGKLNLDETTGLVGFMNPSSALSKVDYDGQSTAASNTPVNYLAQLQVSIDAALARQETNTARSLELAKQALTRYQG